MKIGDLVTYQGRPCYLRGLDPMGVVHRRAQLEDAVTGQQLSVPFDQVKAAAPGR